VALKRLAKQSELSQPSYGAILVLKPTMENFCIRKEVFPVEEISLYIKSNYSRIMIGSYLSSIGGQTHR